MHCRGFETHTNKRRVHSSQIWIIGTPIPPEGERRGGGGAAKNEAATSQRPCHAWMGWRLVSAKSVTIPPKHPEKMCDTKLNEACATSGTSIRSGNTSRDKRSICKISSANNPSRIIATRFTILRTASRDIVTTTFATTVDTLGLNKKPKVPSSKSHLTQKKRSHIHLKVFTMNSTTQCLLFKFGSVATFGTTGTQGAGSPTSNSLKIPYARANLTSAGSPEYLLATFCKRSGLMLSKVDPLRGPPATTVLPCLATKFCIAWTPTYHDRTLQTLGLGQGRQQWAKIWVSNHLKTPRGQL